MLFVEAAAANPELISYVHNLNLRTIATPKAGRKNKPVLSTIARLSSVRSLRIAGGLPGTDGEEESGRDAGLDQDTAAVIVSLLLLPQLRSLSLVNIVGYPAEFVTLGANLDTLSAFRSSIGEDSDYPHL
jgi:hypothetical protein